MYSMTAVRCSKFVKQWACMQVHMSFYHYFIQGPGLFEPIHGSAPDIAGQVSSKILCSYFMYYYFLFNIVQRKYVMLFFIHLFNKLY
jgi:Isocitrate/isopropylmalate dehydrogenase